MIDRLLFYLKAWIELMKTRWQTIILFLVGTALLGLAVYLGTLALMDLIDDTVLTALLEH